MAHEDDQLTPPCQASLNPRAPSVCLQGPPAARTSLCPTRPPPAHLCQLLADTHVHPCSLFSPAILSPPFFQSPTWLARLSMQQVGHLGAWPWLQGCQWALTVSCLSLHHTYATPSLCSSLSPVWDGCRAHGPLTGVLSQSLPVIAQTCSPSSHRTVTAVLGDTRVPCMGSPLGPAVPSVGLCPATALGQVLLGYSYGHRHSPEWYLGKPSLLPSTQTPELQTRSREGGHPGPASSGHSFPHEDATTQVAGKTGHGVSRWRTQGSQQRARTLWGGVPVSLRATEGWACLDCSLQHNSLGTSR